MDTTLTIKTNKPLVDAAKKVASDLGIPLSTAINSMMRQFVRDQEITLSARIPNAETQRAMRDVRDRKNLETFGTFEQWEKSMRSL
jgi:addiction module RelB/DinJ family antitoxin